MEPQKEVSWLHRSDDWGGKPHVDIYIRNEAGKVIDQDHGRSPTLNPPVRDGNAIPLADRKDLPAPYGNVD